MLIFLTHKHWHYTYSRELFLGQKIDTRSIHQQHFCKSFYKFLNIEKIAALLGSTRFLIFL
jgi:hypothetical protein